MGSGRARGFRQRRNPSPRWVPAGEPIRRGNPPRLGVKGGPGSKRYLALKQIRSQRRAREQERGQGGALNGNPKRNPKRKGLSPRRSTLRQLVTCETIGCGVCPFGGGALVRAPCGHGRDPACHPIHPSYALTFQLLRTVLALFP